MNTSGSCSCPPPWALVEFLYPLVQGLSSTQSSYWIEKIVLLKSSSPFYGHLGCPISPVLIQKEKRHREGEPCLCMLGSCQGAVELLHISHRKANCLVTCHSKFPTSFLCLGSISTQSPGERINLVFSFRKLTISHKGLAWFASIRLRCNVISGHLLGRSLSNPLSLKGSVSLSVKSRYCLPFIFARLKETSWENP